MSRKSTGWKGPEEVTQEWTEINDTVEEGRKQWEEWGGWGITLLPVDYLYNGQLPHRSQMTWESRTQETLILRTRKKCHRADMNSPRPGPLGQRLCRMLPIVRPGAQTPGPDLSQHRAAFIACNSWEVTLLLSCFQCRQLPGPSSLPLSSFLLSMLPVFDHRVPSTRVSFLLI